MPTAESTRVKLRAAARSRRASTQDASPSGRSTSAAASSGSTVTRWGSKPSAGKTSAVGCRAAVKRMRSIHASPNIRRVSRTNPGGSMFRAGFRRVISPGGAARLPDRWPAETIRDVLVAQGNELDTLRRDPAAHPSTGIPGCGIWAVSSRTGSPDRRGPPDVQAISRALAGTGAGVLAIDFRGHGRSGGLSTVGAEEIHDVAAAVAWLRPAGTPAWPCSAGRWAARPCCATPAWAATPTRS